MTPLYPSLTPLRALAAMRKLDAVVVALRAMEDTALSYSANTVERVADELRDHVAHGLSKRRRRRAKR